MKKLQKKLRLTRETLRILDSGALARAAGARHPSANAGNMCDSQAYPAACADNDADLPGGAGDPDVPRPGESMYCGDSLGVAMTC